MLQQTAVQAATSIVPIGITPQSVLIVEDHRLTRDVLTEYARDLGFETVTASCAYEGLRIAAVNRPDAILLDGLLPQMHGFELTRLLRNIDPGYRPRIILMTAIYKHIRYQNEARLKYGIDTYIIKPVSKEQLSEVLS
ncbi:MAG TPA: response regulator [Thermoanaerobaculia bacterium]|nr:response regulator [Thermoanaerobaculia bacterium]